MAEPRSVTVLSYPTLTDYELGWVVGLFEGEGHIGTSKNGRYEGNWWRINVAMSNTDLHLLRRFQAIVGCGRIYKRNHVYANPRAKQQWMWALTCDAERRWFIDLIYPHLSTRRRVQARRALMVPPPKRPRFVNPTAKENLNV